MKLLHLAERAAIVAAPFAGGPRDRRARPVVPADASGDHHRDRQEGRPKTRMVTVVGESGKPFTFEASEEVKNLPQRGGGHRDRRLLRLGRDLGEARQRRRGDRRLAAMRAKPGEKPGGLRLT